MTHTFKHNTAVAEEVCSIPYVLLIVLQVGMMSYIYTIIRANTQERQRERERVELLAWIRVPSLEERESWILRWSSITYSDLP